MPVNDIINEIFSRYILRGDENCIGEPVIHPEHMIRMKLLDDDAMKTAKACADLSYFQELAKKNLLNHNS